MKTIAASSQDVLIIGGGVIGLALARELRRVGGAGKITILEKNPVSGSEASYAAAGMLAPQAETDGFNDFYYFCRAGCDLYPDFADELLDETGIDIELDRNGTLYLAFTNSDTEEIRCRFEWQRSAGLAVERLSAAEALKAEPFISPDVREALYFPNDWQVENRKLLEALQEYARLNRIEIIANAEVKSLMIENGKIAGAQTPDSKFRAETVVLTTGAWTSLIETGGHDSPPLLLPPIVPIRGQMFGCRTAKRLFTKVIYSPRGYIVPRADGRILFGATVENAGFDKTVTASGIDFLREKALEISPSLVNLEMNEKWAGLRPFAADGLPVLGAVAGAQNLFIAAAHYRNGILLAPLTARIMAKKITENADSKYLHVFGAERFRKAKALSVNE